MLNDANSIKNHSVKLSIVESLRLNFEFLIRNIWLILFALFLFLFNVLHSHRGIINYNIGNNSKLCFTLPLTIVVIIVPSSILLYFLHLLRRRVTEVVVKASVFAFLEKMAIFVLLLIGLITQSVSSWMSFESFFSLMFEDSILSIKTSQREQDEGIRKILSDREKIIKDEIANIDIKIKKNNDRIEFARDKHLSLDYRYRTMKKDYMNEIETAEKVNDALFNQRNEYLDSLENLRFRFGQLIQTTAVNNNKLKAANVLNGTSIVISKNDYLNIIFVCLLLLLSVCLDIFLAMIFCIIQNAYHKFYEQEFLYLVQLPIVNVVGKKEDIQNTEISISKEDEKPFKGVDKSLEFISSNLEDDKRTIKSLRKINKETKVPDYRIRQYLSDLMDRGLVIKDKRRLLLNIDQN
ncbi:hypothetical protein bcCo53_001434 (plasmid) [Borrelia coriaceae]|nr:hypothetical protein [Borrelia coriaceae]UPA17256.1 hypothetical protein bcCo53_001434 [Borrelia coriaceae]